MVTAAIMVAGCNKDDSNPLPPIFTVPTSALVQTGGTISIDVTNISTPGGFSDMTAEVTSGSGSVVVSSKPPAGSTIGSGKVNFTAGNDPGVATIEITVTDNNGQSAKNQVTVEIQTEAPPTLEEVTGITPQQDDLFNLAFAEKNGVQVVRLTGSINRSITLKGDVTWLLAGSIFVVPSTAGGSEVPTILTIEPGATLYFDAQSAQVSFLAVTQGAQLNADGGNASGLIRMTSSNSMANASIAPDGGDWGGLILNGRAKINVGASAEGEGGTGTYGGDKDDDSSGTLRYVRIEYAGRIVGVDNELNGFSFNACGSGTTLEYLQSYYGEDDGFEWFGGTVSIKHAVSTASRDDSFDWTHGWRGTGQFMVVEQISGRGDRGFECDNLDGNFTATPYSDPILSNITVVNTDGNEGATQGFRLRHGTRGRIHNVLVTGSYSAGIRADDDGGTTGANVADGTLVVTNSIVFDLAMDATAWAREAAGWESTNGNATGAPEGFTLDGGIGVVTQGAVDPTTVYENAGFISVSFIGAVDPANNWLTGWALRSDGTMTY